MLFDIILGDQETTKVPYSRVNILQYAKVMNEQNER